jgi:hypothetical protein
MSEPREKMRRALETKALLEDLEEYLHGNPPANGWGLIDNRANEERRELLARIRGALEAGEGA